MSGPFTRRVLPADEQRTERFTSACVSCGIEYTMPNKGLGRANVAAWESRHRCNEESK